MPIAIITSMYNIVQRDAQYMHSVRTLTAIMVLVFVNSILETVPKAPSPR